MAQLAASQDSDQCRLHGRVCTYNSCVVRSVIAHFALWRIIRVKHNMVDTGINGAHFSEHFDTKFEKLYFFRTR